MRGEFAAVIIVLLASQAAGDTLVPSQTLRANTIVTGADLVLRPVDTPGALSDPDQVIGQETRVTLYAGRPIRPGDIGPPALVERNQIVVLQYIANGLSINVDGRSLGRGGVGDRVRVMNLASRTTLFGNVQMDGTIKVSQ
ncbi:flagellar basal body P-ring formation chaperone FlgA [Marinovum sp. 2_MG-2023]|uniref:flagellar basal body P-ring formation chaperone FlgA n=1 Tax=unclassified Marinovum TaxID=2647166 RepID=UPI0026E3D3D2|nr:MULTISPECIES: flagellar basal body P-ring formation chaperone FlgA [unclassified Marinovum]MDO6729758.1 flagellar basal body P-ring formation chaperone FlgA [Marinovum sp. 2_MG-2023]MDO6779572.1 flagellar basal body P-ring formation chaperone FlgA [Marinovum sp. 1_MG-2023]